MIAQWNNLQHFSYSQDIIHDTHPKCIKSSQIICAQHGEQGIIYRQGIIYGLTKPPLTGDIEMAPNPCSAGSVGAGQGPNPFQRAVPAPVGIPSPGWALPASILLHTTCDLWFGGDEQCFRGRGADSTLIGLVLTSSNQFSLSLRTWNNTLWNNTTSTASGIAQQPKQGTFHPVLGSGAWWGWVPIPVVFTHRELEKTQNLSKDSRWKTFCI